MKSENVRVVALTNVLGRDAWTYFEKFQGEKEGDNFKITKVLEECCVPARNEWFERYKFFERISRVRRISWHVHTVTTLLWLSETYDFGDFREVFITDRFVHGLRGRRPVWGEKGLKGVGCKARVQSHKKKRGRGEKVREAITRPSYNRPSQAPLPQNGTTATQTNSYIKSETTLFERSCWGSVIWIWISESQYWKPAKLWSYKNEDRQREKH